jgi:hypothetical protein
MRCKREENQVSITHKQATIAAKNVFYLSAMAEIETTFLAVFLTLNSIFSNSTKTFFFAR